MNKGKNMSELLPIAHFQVMKFCTVVPKWLSAMWWIQGAYSLMVEWDIFMGTGLTKSVYWVDLAATPAT